MLQEVFVQRVSDLQLADKRERIYLFIAIEDLGKLTLTEIDVVFEAISWPHFDIEELVATPFDSLASSILCEEGLNDLCKVIERVGW